MCSNCLHAIETNNTVKVLLKFILMCFRKGTWVKKKQPQKSETIKYVIGLKWVSIYWDLPLHSKLTTKRCSMHKQYSSVERFFIYISSSLQMTLKNDMTPFLKR